MSSAPPVYERRNNPRHSTHWMTFADPIHGMIRLNLDRPAHQLMKAVMDTGAFQRLRRVKQMGMAEFVFPGATHSRFLHSIGALWLMMQAIEHFQSDPKAKAMLNSPYTGTDIPIETLLLLGILVHDIGHPPLSHSLEDILGLHAAGLEHDRYWNRLILLEDPELKAIWNQYGLDLPVALLRFMGDHTVAPERTELPTEKHVMAQLVSSQLDMDRLDYLQRDSHFMGVQYGRIEAERIVFNLVLAKLPAPDASRQVVAIREEAVPALEHYLFGRYQAYKMALHSLDKASESLLKKTLQRFYWVRQNGEDPGDPAEVLFQLMLAGKQEGPPPDVAAYLRMDDCYLWDKIHQWSVASADPLLKTLAGRMLHHQTFKFVDLTRYWPDWKETPVRLEALKQRLATYYHQHGLSIDFGFDQTYVKPKAMYQPSGSREPIWVKTQQYGVVDLREVSTLPMSVPADAVNRGDKYLWFVWDKPAQQWLLKQLSE